MKFGKRLQFEASALGVQEHVLDYKALKRVIKAMVAQPPLAPAYDARVSCSSEHIASPFAVALRAEWARLAPFFLQRERDLQRQWRRVLCLFESPSAAATGSAGPHKAEFLTPLLVIAAERERCLLDIYDAILALRKCVSLNFLGMYSFVSCIASRARLIPFSSCSFTHTGSVKIIKKHDKNIDSAVSSFLLPQLYALPFITSRTAALVETQLEVCLLFSYWYILITRTHHYKSTFFSFSYTRTDPIAVVLGRSIANQSHLLFWSVDRLTGAIVVPDACVVSLRHLPRLASGRFFLFLLSCPTFAFVHQQHYHIIMRPSILPFMRRVCGRARTPRVPDLSPSAFTLDRSRSGARRRRRRRHQYCR
jgi:hypothetical protein